MAFKRIGAPLIRGISGHNIVINWYISMYAYYFHQNVVSCSNLTHRSYRVLVVA